MIDQLRTMAVFQAVAELGSFRAAAKKLGLSPSVISHHVTQLETQLGAPLLYRSTRRISLTDAGTDLLAASQKMTRAAQEGLASVHRRTNQPVGKLSITTATATAHSPYVEMYTDFARAYPKVQLSVNLEDRSAALEGSKFDLAIRGRAHDLDDSTYKSRRLAHIDMCIVASPDYVNSRPKPKTFDDLMDWDWIEWPPNSWFPAELSVRNARPNVAMSCDSHTFARKFLFEGFGFMIDTYPPFADDIRAGRLVHVLPDLKLPRLDTYAIYPANTPRDGLAKLFVDFMLQHEIGNSPGFTPA